ncbi:MAG TPA: peptidase M28 family protein, partial [Verrucomicrobiae bacterium]|nr:peptidase M28 family protein [Verrucomicrobiae bacterium]
MGLKLLKGSLLFLLLIVFGRVSAQVADDSTLIRRLADTILTDWKTYGNLAVLTKKVGPRLSGSPGYYKAEKWGVAALKDAGAANVRLQECMVPHWVRGGKDEALCTWPDGRKPEKGTDFQLDILALGNSVGTGPGGVRAPVVLIHDFDELERRKGELKG